MTESLSMPFCHSWTQDRPGSLLGSVLLGTGPGRRETSQPRAKDPGRLFPTPARSLLCSRPRPLPAALQASTNRRRKEPGVCLRWSALNFRRPCQSPAPRSGRIQGSWRGQGAVWEQEELRRRMDLGWQLSLSPLETLETDSSDVWRGP